MPVARYPTCLLKLDTAAFAPSLRLKSSDFTSKNTGTTLTRNSMVLSKVGGFRWVVNRLLLDQFFGSGLHRLRHSNQLIDGHMQLFPTDWVRLKPGGKYFLEVLGVLDHP